MFRGWARGLTRILRLTVEVRGTPPTPPFLLVTNHLSYVDVIVLASCAPAVFVAKQEVRGWPIWGMLAALVGTIFVDRNDRRDALRVTECIRAAVAAGEGVVVFPEGTSSPGTEVLPLKPALLEAAASSDWPVRYASLSYGVPEDEAPAHLAVCWWGDMSFAPHLAGLCRLSEFQALVVFGPEEVRGSDRKVLAIRLHEVIAQQFTPVITRNWP
ncbi:MAG TPA: lysophospholipid acyltransferase family protein [Streptosporangiaceae bacterium]|nr:lysophospholipid acyltransferase family protein [Streptosporangiaceae bacterium]